MGELLREDSGVLLAREVTVLDPPLGDGVDDPADHLPHGGLALGRPELPAEVLLGHDVRGVLRPGRGKLHAALLEGIAALLVVGDDGVANLPVHLVERVRALLGEMAPERELAGLDPYVLLLRGHLALLLEKIPGKDLDRWTHLSLRTSGGKSHRYDSGDSVPGVRSCQVPRPILSHMLWESAERGVATTICCGGRAHPERQSGLGPGPARCCPLGRCFHN